LRAVSSGRRTDTVREERFMALVRDSVWPLKREVRMKPLAPGTIRERESVMAAKKNEKLTIPRVSIKKGDNLKTIYAKARKAFTAADLAKFAEEEEMIPAEQILVELEAYQRQADEKAKTAKKPKKHPKKKAAS
jgi:hypothetical protein